MERHVPSRIRRKGSGRWCGFPVSPPKKHLNGCARRCKMKTGKDLLMIGREAFDGGGFENCPHPWDLLGGGDLGRESLPPEGHLVPRRLEHHEKGKAGDLQ